MRYAKYVVCMHSFMCPLINIIHTITFNYEVCNYVLCIAQLINFMLPQFLVICTIFTLAKLKV